VRSTCLALARAPVCCTEHSDVTLRARWTSRAIRLAGQILVEITQAIAIEATGLALFGLELSWIAWSALGTAQLIFGTMCAWGAWNAASTIYDPVGATRPEVDEATRRGPARIFNDVAQSEALRRAGVRPSKDHHVAFDPSVGIGASLVFNREDKWIVVYVRAQSRKIDGSDGWAIYSFAQISTNVRYGQVSGTWRIVYRRNSGRNGCWRGCTLSVECAVRYRIAEVVVSKGIRIRYVNHFIDSALQDSNRQI
jgi:hypothetical protein